jgi:hypothetical protein
MKNKHQKILSWRKAKGCTLNCKINLDRLFETAKEREKFNEKWKDFIASDPDNKKVYKINGNILSYKSEQLIPTKTNQRPPLLLVLGNPATHSVESGMFFSFEGNKFEGNIKEHRFWKYILKPAGIFDLPFDEGQSVEKLNQQRRQALYNLDNEFPFQIGLTVIISMPSAASIKKWSGVDGIKRLIGANAMSLLEKEETKRVLECAKNFVTPKGAVIAFQKNAWNNLRSKNDPIYELKRARAGELKGTLKGSLKIPLFCVPPTRLSGPCSEVLEGFIKNI